MHVFVDKNDDLEAEKRNTKSYAGHTHTLMRKNVHNLTFEKSKPGFFEIENGFVGIWTKRNRNQDPDISVNVEDVLTIEPIE